MNISSKERTLDSFADDIIVRVEPAADGRWWATLDVGLWRFNGDPEFGIADRDRDTAIQRCAQAIRDDAAGIGRHAPHTLLSPTGYDFRNRLCRHWATKECLRELGHDPNQFVLDVDACLEQGDRWKLKGSFDAWSRESRVFEAGFRLALVDLQDTLGAGATADKAVEAFWQSMGTVKAGLRRTQPTEATWALVDARLARAMEALLCGTGDRCTGDRCIGDNNHAPPAADPALVMRPTAGRGEPPAPGWAGLS